MDAAIEIDWFRTYYTLKITVLGSREVSLVLRANIFNQHEHSHSTRTTHILCFENYYCVVVRSSIGFQLQIPYQMKQERLCELALLNIHRHIDLSVNDIITRFAPMKRAINIIIQMHKRLQVIL